MSYEQVSYAIGVLMALFIIAKQKYELHKANKKKNMYRTLCMKLFSKDTANLLKDFEKPYRRPHETI